MHSDRERQVTSAFVELAGALATGYEVVDLFSTLAQRCAQLLDIAAVGLLLSDARGVLHVAAASSSNALHLESFQVQQAQGPCLDCFHTGAPVAVADLREQRERWPRFTEAAHLAGFASVHALPLHLGTNTIGAMGLFGTAPGPLNELDLRLGQALADIASIAVIQQRAASDKSIVIEQLEHALTSRVVIEQAKGVLAQAGHLPMDDAFGALRRYSRNNNRKLTEVAYDIVARKLPSADVLGHPRTAPASG